MLWYLFLCTLCHAPNHCVAKCHIRKALVNKMNMSIGIETEKGNSHPSLKIFVPRDAHKNLCTHCNISGHWVEKCWKLNPQLHPNKGNKFMQAPEEESTKEKVAQVVTIHEATQEGKQVQVESSFT